MFAGPACVARRSASFAESAGRVLSSQEPFGESLRSSWVTAQVIQLDDRPGGRDEGSADAAVGADLSDQTSRQILCELRIVGRGFAEQATGEDTLPGGSRSEIGLKPCETFHCHHPNRQASSPPATMIRISPRATSRQGRIGLRY